MLNILISKSIINKFLKTSITAKFASIKANQYSIFYKALLSQKSYKHNSIYNIKKFNFTTNLQEDIHNIKFKISYPNMLKPEEHKIAESITITETCVEKNIPSLFLRVMVEGGGCSGYQYIFKMDENLNKDEDLVYAIEDVNKSRVVIDKISLPFLEGAIIDYKETMMKSSFYIKENPKAEISCSCGTSFSPKFNKI